LARVFSAFAIHDENLKIVAELCADLNSRSTTVRIILEVIEHGAHRIKHLLGKLGIFFGIPQGQKV
jgi:hypothetical protein